MAYANGRAGERGRQAGAAWAADAAEYLELKRLAAAAAHWRGDDEPAGYTIVRTILGERRLIWASVEEFRETIGLDSDDAKSRDYWQGFVQSALEAFEQVEI